MICLGVILSGRGREGETERELKFQLPFWKKSLVIPYGNLHSISVSTYDYSLYIECEKKTSFFDNMGGGREGSSFPSPYPPLPLRRYAGYRK